MNFIIKNLSWIIPLSLIGLIILIIGSTLLKQKLQDVRLENMAKKTQQFIEKKAMSFLVTYIDAPQGSGKTTFAAGLTNALTLRNIHLFKSRIKNTTITFYDVDFDNINKIIEQCYNDRKSAKECYSILLDEYEIFYESIDDGLRLTSGTKVLRNYIEAYYAILRDNYVMYEGTAEGTFISYVNGKPAMSFTPEFMDLKDIYWDADKAFKIPRGTIIFEDEKQNSGKDCYHNLELVKDDRGSQKFFEYIRHLGEESIFYVTTDQNFGSAASVERKLSTSIVRIIGRDEKIIKKPLDKYYEFLEKFYTWVYTKKSKKSEAEVLLQNYRLRQKLYKLKKRRRFIFAASYVVYRVRIYHSHEDVHRTVNSSTFDADEVTLTFPIKSVYGSINTMQYAYLYDMLRPENDFDNLSMLSPEDQAQQIFKKIDDERALRKMEKAEELKAELERRKLEREKAQAEKDKAIAEKRQQELEKNE